MNSPSLFAKIPIDKRAAPRRCDPEEKERNEGEGRIRHCLYIESNKEKPGEKLYAHRFHAGSPLFVFKFQEVQALICTFVSRFALKIHA